MVITQASIKQAPRGADDEGKDVHEEGEAWQQEHKDEFIARIDGSPRPASFWYEKLRNWALNGTRMPNNKRLTKDIAEEIITRHEEDKKPEPYAAWRGYGLQLQ